MTTPRQVGVRLLRRLGWRVGRPEKSLGREQMELWLLYLGSLSGVLLLFALVLRGVFHQSQLAMIRSDLAVIGEDLAWQPLPKAGKERDLLRGRRDFATAHQQIEWFPAGARQPTARLGEVRALGPHWIALVRPLEDDGQEGGSAARGWLRVSAGLESSQGQLRRLDASLAAGILLALALSTVSARVITRRAVQPLEQSLDRLRQFSLDASHELRGPLAALAANAEMGLLDTAPGDPAQRRRFQAIADATDQMEGLVEDLLLLARQDESRSDQFLRLDLGELIDAQAALHRDGIGLRSQRLTLELESGLIVLRDAVLLHRLLRNLIENAMRFTPDHGLITITAWRQGAMVTVAVEDSGEGLEEAHIPRVFDRFWRASPDRGDGGSGLGLAIAARICAAHGGTIQVASRRGMGSRFVVELPTV